MASFDRFAYPVETIEELPPAIGAGLRERLEAGEALRQIVFAPRQQHAMRIRGAASWFSGVYTWRPTPDWVLALSEERLFLATIPPAPRPPEVTTTALADLLWAELGAILLYSWFEWSSVFDGGTRRQRVYYNTVRDDLFWRLLEAIRRTIISQTHLPEITGQRDRSPFKGLPFKFANLIPRRLLLPGERVQALAFQGAIWRRRLGVFRHQRAPATALVLTPQHLLVAQDEHTQTGSTHGLISRYYPRSRVRGARVEQAEDDLWLRIDTGRVDAEDRQELLFETAAEPALRNLVAQL